MFFRVVGSLALAAACTLTLAWMPHVEFSSDTHAPTLAAHVPEAKGRTEFTLTRTTLADRYAFGESPPVCRSGPPRPTWIHLVLGLDPDRSVAAQLDPSPTLDLTDLPRAYRRCVFTKGPEWYAKGLYGYPEMAFISGWPCRWISCGHYPQVLNGNTMYGGLRGGFVAPVLNRTVPADVHAAPLIANLAILTGAFELSWFGVRETRRRMRPLFNRCVRCDYALVGIASPVCPECGKQTVRDAGEDCAAPSQ